MVRKSRAIAKVRTRRAVAPIVIRPNVSETHLDLPEQLTFDAWWNLGITLGRAERAVSWWIGDWWSFGRHHYGDRADMVRDPKWTGPAFQTCMNCAQIARVFETSRRREVLSFSHHAEVAGLEPIDADRLLDAAEADELSTMELRALVRKFRAGQRLGLLIEQPLPVGDPVHVIYADPPWRYENPPMGGGNRAIENHYPTMTLEEICALEVSACALPDAVLFLWATAPKCAECIQVIGAWGFTYRTQLVWDKVDIGMGYHARNQHELLLIAKRGSIPPPAPEDRPASIYAERRTEHSRKPTYYYDLIERMYPGLRKRELFARPGEDVRSGWEEPWGNQVGLRADAAEAAA